MTNPLAYIGASGLFTTDTQYPSGRPLPQVTLADIKQDLRQTTAANDAELQTFLDAACNRIADICVPLAPASVVDTFDGQQGAGTLVLSTFPVLTVTSVTVYDAMGNASTVAEAGGAMGLTDGYRKDLSAGTLRRIGYRTWPAGWGNIVVAYTAGPSYTPAEVVLSVRTTVRVWWESRRLSGNLRAPGGTNSEPGDQPEPTFGIPDDAYDLLLSYLKQPRVA